jgi:rod shape-determining protein MreD
MKRVVTWVLLFLIGVLLQTTMMPQLAIAGVYPDAVVILIVILSLDHGRLSGIWGGFFIGLLLDVYSPGLLGQQALAKTITGGFVGFFSRERIDLGPVGQLIIMVGAVAIHDIIFYVPSLDSASRDLGTISLFVFTTALPRALYTALLASFILFTRHYFFPFRRSA